MSYIFKCEGCGNADSIHATQQTSCGYNCSRCKTGTWHGQFPEEQYDFNFHGPALNVPDPDSGQQASFS